MLKTIEGIYQNGQIELSETPDAESVASKVLVTFLDPSKVNVDRLREYLEELETIQGIQQGLADVEAGDSRPLSEFAAEMRHLRLR
jgi:hypothetical protein